MNIHLSNNEIAILSSMSTKRTRKGVFDIARGLLGEHVPDGSLGNSLDRLRDLKLVHQDGITMLLTASDRGQAALTDNFRRVRDFVDHVTLANAASSMTT